MSRVAKSPIEIPAGVVVTIQQLDITVKGPKGELSHTMHPLIGLEQADNALHVRWNEESEEVHHRSGSKNLLKHNVVALAGTTRAIVNNMVLGVTTGYTRALKMVGVGYRAQAQGAKLNITAGFSHPVVFDVPAGITVETPVPTEIIIKGSDKQLVGQVAANIRAIRPPEPYKGKGIRYADEQVLIKETKKK